MCHQFLVRKKGNLELIRYLIGKADLLELGQRLILGHGKFEQDNGGQTGFFFTGRAVRTTFLGGIGESWGFGNFF